LISPATSQKISPVIWSSELLEKKGVLMIREGGECDFDAEVDWQLIIN
jgi:hypothetical protein